MTNLRTTAQQLLGACEQRLPLVGQAKIIDELNNLRAALAEPVQEPVGYLPAYELNRLQSGHDGRLRSAKFGRSALDGDVAVYTAPPKAEPVQEWASIPGTNVRVPLPHRPHDAGSHDQQMTPAVQRVVDAADKRARNKAAMPANCTTPTDCRAHGCHGDCLPAAISTERAEPVQEPVAKVELMMTGGNAGLATRIVEIDDHLRERLRPGQLLYTAPPQRKPLPKHNQHCVDVPGYGLMAVRLVRAIERAHGIVGKA